MRKHALVANNDDMLSAVAGPIGLRRVLGPPAKARAWRGPADFVTSPTPQPDQHKLDGQVQVEMQAAMQAALLKLDDPKSPIAADPVLISHVGLGCGWWWVIWLGVCVDLRPNLNRLWLYRRGRLRLTTSYRDTTMESGMTGLLALLLPMR